MLPVENYYPKLLNCCPPKPVNSQKQSSRPLTLGEKRMTIPKNPFLLRQSTSFRPSWENPRGQVTETEFHYLRALPFFVVNLPLDGKEQPLSLVPLRNERVSRVKFKSHSLKVIVSEIPWLTVKIARERLMKGSFEAAGF